MKLTPRQQLATTNLKGLDDALETYSDALLTGSTDDPGTTPPAKPRSQAGARWKQELTHEQKMEKKLDRIIYLLEQMD